MCIRDRRWIDAGKGNQFLGIGEATDIADLSQNNGTGSRSYARDGQDDRVQLLQLLGNLLVDLIDLLLRELDLLDENANLKGKRIRTQR